MHLGAADWNTRKVLAPVMKTATVLPASRDRVASGAGRAARTGPRAALVVGPSTRTQLMGLRHLGYIAELQGADLDLEPAPLRAGHRRVMPAARGTRRRLVTFAANGLLVFLFGVAIQWVLIHRGGLGNISSYVVKSVVSVQLTFLLSRYLTWGDRNIAVLPAMVRWNVQQLIITSLGVALYIGLAHLGVNYIAGNIVVAAIFTPTSFVVGHLWSMVDQATSLRLTRTDRTVTSRSAGQM